MAERGLFASTFDEFAFIRGILKMQMTEQSPVSEHGAFRHGLHRDEYGEGIGGTGIASVEHIAGFAFQPLVVHMIEPIFMCCDGGAFSSSQVRLKPATASSSPTADGCSICHPPMRNRHSLPEVLQAFAQKRRASPSIMIANSGLDRMAFVESFQARSRFGS